MEAQKKVPTEVFYGRCLITSHPKCVCNLWVPYVFVAWRENGKFQFHRFPELGDYFFSSEAEAREVGFSIARNWVDVL
jgi:hypothetical protein